MPDILKFPGVQNNLLDSFCEILQKRAGWVAEKQVQICFDFAADVKRLGCPPALLSAASHAVDRAISHSPAHSEVLITATQQAHGIEIEIADERIEESGSRNCAFRGELYDDSGVSIRYCQCPQGGLACTLVWSTGQKRAQAA